MPPPTDLCIHILRSDSGKPPYNAFVPSRKYPRLKHYDYATSAAYFVTICTHERKQALGSVSNGVLSLSPLGRLAEEMIGTIPLHRGKRVSIDTHIVMPNHLHLLISLLPLTPTDNEPPYEMGSNTSTIPAIVGSYKSAVTRHWRIYSGETAMQPIWQTSFHEHVVRNEESYWRIQEYIANNPLQWELDRENPARSGEDEFYGWLDRRKRSP